MADDHWTVHRWWVPAELEGAFVRMWRALAEMLVAEGLMEDVSLLADADDNRARWTVLRWSSQTAWKAWRADQQHRSIEDAMAALCERTQVHHITTVLTVGRR